MYLLTAAADLVRTKPVCVDPKFEAAIYTLWDNMVSRKMYVTGGIGAMKQWEGFGLDYFLPQGTDEGGCYSETCAAIGVMMLAERLLQVRTDLLERLVTRLTHIVDSSSWMDVSPTLWNSVCTTLYSRLCLMMASASRTLISLHRATQIYRRERSGSLAPVALQTSCDCSHKSAATSQAIRLMRRMNMQTSRFTSTSPVRSLSVSAIRW